MLITLGGVSVVQPPSYGLAMLITEKKTNFILITYYDLWVFKCIKKVLLLESFKKFGLWK